MKLRRPAGMGGTSKLQFAIVASVFGLLAAILLLRLEAMEAEAERTAMDMVLRNIRVGLQLAVGERIIQGEEHRIADILASNPLNYLARHPPAADGHGSTPAMGEWTYDKGSRELRYHPRQPRAFDDAIRLRWRLVPRIDSAGRTVGVALEEVN
ncbi:MAG: hypothetical protein HZB40_00420 [Rhodocyclales bacterium]|nr:hypothetical protein [Rhodocyclales bacterium]